MEGIIAFYKRNNLMIRWFLSYVLILIVTVLMSVYSYCRMEKSMIKQIDATAGVTLAERQQYIDNIQKNLFIFADDLAADSMVKEISGISYISRSHRYMMAQLQKKIRQVSYFDTDISEAFVYFHNIDYVVGWNICSERKPYFEANYSDTGMNYATYVDVLTQKSVGDFIYLPDKSGSMKGSEVLYKYSVFNNDYNRPVATVVLRMPCSKFMPTEKVDNNLWVFNVVDKNDEVFLTNATGAESRERVNAIIASEKDNFDYNNVRHVKDQFVLVRHSEENKWKYVFTIDENEYISELVFLRRNTVAMVIVYLILGLIIATVMTNRNYKPIKSLENKLRKLSSNPSAVCDTNEIRYIDSIIDKIIKDSEQHNRLNKVQDHVLKDAVFMKLANGESFNEVSVEELLYSLDIEFKHEWFTQVLFYIEDLSGMFFEEDSDESDSAENYELAKTVISNILEDMLKSSYDCVFTNLNGMLLCIVNSAEPDISGNIAEIIGETKTFVADNFNIKFSSGISGTHKELDCIALGYNEALECLEYKFVHPQGIIEYKDVIKQAKTLYYFPIDKELRMISWLKQGDFENASKILDEILTTNINSFNTSILMIKCLMYEIMGMIAKVLSDVNERGEEISFEQVDVFESINECNSILEMKKIILDIFEKICLKTGHNDDTSDRMIQIVERTKEYILENYTNPELNGGMLAEHFGITNTYLSSIFKKQTGKGILEYITHIRIEKALGLIKSTDLNMEKIAVSVGYTNVRTFSRAFAKIIGTSPGKIRGNV